MHSERLTYRRPGRHDRADLHALDNDPAVMQWINGGELIPLDLFTQELLPVYLNYNEQSGFGFWIIEESGEFMGWVSLRPIGEPGTASVGYRLRKSAWGKGYATEAARAMLHVGFGENNLDTIVATTYESNVGSQRVLEKTGMRLVRRFHMTHEVLDQQDTSLSSGEVWDLEDLVYEINSDEFSRGKAD